MGGLTAGAVRNRTEEHKCRAGSSGADAEGAARLPIPAPGSSPCRDRVQRAEFVPHCRGTRCLSAADEDKGC